MDIVIIIVALIVGYVIFIELCKATHPRHTKLFRRIYNSGVLGNWEKRREASEELLRLFMINITADGEIKDTEDVKGNIVLLILYAHEYDIQYKGLQKKINAGNKMADEVVSILLDKFHQSGITEFDEFIWRVRNYLTPEHVTIFKSMAKSIPQGAKKILEDLKYKEVTNK